MKLEDGAGLGGKAMIVPREYALDPDRGAPQLPKGSKRLSWTLNGEDVGKRFWCAGYGTMVVQSSGVFDGTVLSLRGSIKRAPNENEESDWFQLRDRSMVPVRFRGHEGSHVLDPCLWISPAAAGGTGKDIMLELFLTDAKG